MATVDWGAIGFKNKKCLSTENFTSPLETVGYVNDEIGNKYFIVIGDRDISIGFFKDTFTLFYNGSKIDTFFCNQEKGVSSRAQYKKVGNEVHGRFTNFTVKDGSMYWTIKIEKDGTYTFYGRYKNNDYEVHFGYGIDLKYYLKSNKYNYYTSFNYYWRGFKQACKMTPEYIHIFGLVEGIKMAKDWIK